MFIGRTPRSLTLLIGQTSVSVVDHSEPARCQQADTLSRPVA
jgi:hypothetical protein